jgi:hypothetical protein
MRKRLLVLVFTSMLTGACASGGSAHSNADSAIRALR